jgi:DNA-directed RNA polymerase specialized sigma subunit
LNRKLGVIVAEGVVSHGVVFGPRGVIQLRHLIRRKQMVKCSKAEVRRLKTALRWKIPVAQRERIQMVLLRESGMTQPSIAAVMGVSLSTVNRRAHGL